MNEDLEMYCRFSSKNEIGSEGNSRNIQTRQRTKIRTNTGKILLLTLCGLVRN